LANRFIYKPVVVQAPRGPFGSILPSSSITATTTKIPTCPACYVVLFASQFWRTAHARCSPVRVPVLPPRTVPVLPTGLRLSRSPYLKRVLSRVPSRIQLRARYSAAVLLVSIFSQFFIFFEPPLRLYVGTQLRLRRSRARFFCFAIHCRAVLLVMTARFRLWKFMISTSARDFCRFCFRWQNALRSTNEIAVGSSC
jgi:hypothetical protein